MNAAHQRHDRIPDPPGLRQRLTMSQPKRDHARRKRPSLRWRHWDYARPGAYFVTICVAERRCILGRVIDEDFMPDALGLIVDETWSLLPEYHSRLELGPFVVMPNHVHGVIGLLEDDPRPARAGRGPTPTDPDETLSPRPTLPQIVRSFKSLSARRINLRRGTTGQPVWQRGYHDRVIRSEREFNAIAKYVEANPARWSSDRENPRRR